MYDGPGHARETRVSNRTSSIATMRRRRRGVVVCLLLLIILLPVPALAVGVGVFPQTLEFGEVLRGARLTRSLGVINDSDEPRILTFGSTGAVGPWLTASRPTDGRVLEALEMAPGERASVNITMVVPDEVSNGSVSGELRVVSNPTPDNTQDGAEVGVGVVVPVNASVTGTQNLAGRIVEFFLSEVEAGLPLIGTVTITNESNVTIQPDVSMEVFFDSESVGIVEVETLALATGESGTFVAEWPTSGQPEGDYTARVEASLSDLRLEPRIADFTLLPSGSLSRSGELQTLELDNLPGPGGIAVVNATVVNDGQVETKVRFIGDLRLEGLVVQPVGSLDRRILPDESVVIQLFMDVEREGIYTLSGRADFDGVQSEVRSLTFEVGAEDSIWSRPSTWIIGVGGLVLLALLLVVLIRYSRYLERR